MVKMINFLESIEKYILCLTIALFGIFVVLNSTSPAVISKGELLFAGGSVVLLIWVIKTFIKGSISSALGRFDLPVLLIVASYVLSTLIKTPNKMEAFLSPGITTFVATSAVFYFLINQLGKKAKEGARAALLVSGVLYGVSILLTELGLFTKIPQLPALIKDATFNPLGGTIPGIIYLTPLLFIFLGEIFRDKDIVKKIFWGVSMALVIMALVILVESSLPGKPQSPKLPSFQVSWEVAVTTLGKSPILGIGPGNYLTAFNQFRPVSYNLTDLWTLRFTTASDFYLTALTETGMLGAASFIFLILAIYKFVISDIKFGKSMETVGDSLGKLALPAAIILFAGLPVAPTLIFPFFVLLGLNSGSEERVVVLNTLSVGANTRLAPRIPALILGIIMLAGASAADFFGTKMILAEQTFTKALSALSKNDAKNTYNSMQSAINQNPKVDRYHASLAQVDMALASSLANKKDLADSDKTAITQLVQQAINEGKATVTLNPGRSGNWEVLAQIYRSIMPFAQGADQFAIQTYTQAVALDPTNPSLRIALGGIYYSLGRYDDAIDTFKLATLAKPDLGNAHYNLATAYREKRDYDKAIAEMKIVLSLVNKDSQDYTLAKNTLDELEKNKPATPATGTSNLTPPQPAGVSKINPPITLPKEATPPTTP